MKIVLDSGGNVVKLLRGDGINRGQHRSKPIEVEWEKGQKAYPENITRTVPIFPALYQIRDRIEREDWRYRPASVSDNLSRVWTECTVKDLRHTFITKARQSGVENELVNLWTGHLPEKNVTANVYTHFSIEFQKAQAQKVSI